MGLAKEAINGTENQTTPALTWAWFLSNTAGFQNEDL